MALSWQPAFFVDRVISATYLGPRFRKFKPLRGREGALEGFLFLFWKIRTQRPSHPTANTKTFCQTLPVIEFPRVLFIPMAHLRSYFPHLSIFLVAVCLYAGTITHEHVLDDLELIPNQPAIRDPWNVRDILLGRYWGVLREQDVLYRPLTIWTLGVNYWANEVMGLSGEHPAVYHSVNVLFHALVSGLACAFFVRLGVGIQIAWVVALLFAVHPIHTEVVAAAVNRSERLALGFGLGMLILHLGKRQMLWAGVCFFCAMLSKESALLLLPLAVWMDWAMEGKMRWKQYGAYAMAIVGWFVLRSMATGDAVQAVLPIDNPLVEVGFISRLLTALWIQGEYLWLQILPWGLSSDYSFNQIAVVSTLWNAQVLGFGLVLVGGFVWAWRVRETFPVGLLALGGYGILFAVTSNVMLPIGTIMGERLAYGPSLFFCLLVGIGLCRLPKQWVWPVVMMLVLVLAGLTLGRNRVWANQGVFYRAQVVSAPNSAKAHYSVARGVYHPNGDLDSARVHYEKAVALLPNYPDAWNNLGMILVDQGDLVGALNAYQTALEWHVGHVQARFNLAQLYQSQGGNTEAIRMYEQVLAQKPTHAAACNNLAVLYIQAGQIDAARVLLDRAIVLDPNYEAAQINRERLRLLEEE